MIISTSPRHLRKLHASLALMVAVASCASWSAAAWASGLDSLTVFVKTTKSGRATFTQVVTAPPKDGVAGRSKTSTGRFEFERPGHFRFVYQKPFEQVIVADGQTLWLYDLDLNQVTARKQAQVLGSTPAALIAAAPDLKALEADFNLQAAPDKDGLQWLQATPKARDGQLQSVRVGFRAVGQGSASHSELAVLDVQDSFGQRSVLSFTGFEINPALPASTFVFKPPQGADVVRQ
jgi:outer membrane lipoprotein carrier protein